ncbi:RNA polymerase sigma factor [Gaoshiqia sediminis]|uniref:Sigma-70 family RNA polymerase sigma factor n=1 Tax=Gaoshiqia sediminis TaxID=2986998 RepID=A0AA41Y6M0_9BACT|nr:sigma-70 family RNA polymerase sigma factor [Gaoshiqia sediminis]MCW0481873.1 sigma-70 family RNA polymerase sigma factor [Gaoshiqia sediminis]
MDHASSYHIDFYWQSFVAGDDRSFTNLYQQVAGNMMAYGSKFNIDRELVGDALQDVFVDLYLKRDRLGINIKNPKAYLFIALKNNLLKKIASNKKWQFQLLEDKGAELEFATEYSIQDQLVEQEVSAEIQEKIKRAIAGLSPRQKEIIYLKFEEELDYPEVARILGISMESARKQLYRALKTLREIIDKKTLTNLLLIFLKKSQ